MHAELELARSVLASTLNPDAAFRKPAEEWLAAAEEQKLPAHILIEVPRHSDREFSSLNQRNTFA